MLSTARNAVFTIDHRERIYPGRRVPKAAIPGIFLSILCGLSCVGPTSRTDSLEQKGETTMAPEPAPRQLPPGRPLKVEMAGGETHSYRIEATPGDFLRVVVEQLGIDVALRLLDRREQQLVRVDSPTGAQGPETVAAVAGDDGVLLLEIAAPEGAGQGRYSLLLEPPRPATETDRNRVTAEGAFAQGEEFRRSGNFGAAQQAYERAVVSWSALGDEEMRAKALYRQGWIHDDDAPRAAAYYEPALAIYRRLERPREEATLCNRLGRASLRLGRFEEASQLHQEARELFERLGNLGGQVDALGGLGDVYRWTGGFQLALEAYQGALDLLEQTHNSRTQARMLVSLGEIYLHVNDLERAEARLLQAQELLHPGGSVPKEEIRCLRHLGSLADLQARPEQARRHLEAALALVRGPVPEKRDGRTEAILLAELGTAFLKTGELKASRQTLTQALESFRRFGDTHGEGMALHKLGRCAYGEGELHEAYQQHAAAIPLLQLSGDRRAVAAARFGAARAARDLGDLEGALGLLQKAAKVVQVLRTETASPSLRASYFASREHYWELFVDVLMRLHEREPDAGFDAMAFDVTEQWRARGLLDLLAESGTDPSRGASDDLLKQEAGLRDQIDDLERGRLEHLWNDRQEASKHLGKELEIRLEELDRVRGEIRRRRPRDEEWLDPSPLQLAQIQELLEGRRLLLAYFLGPERSFLWAISATSSRVTELPPRDVIEETARRLRHLLPQTGGPSEGPRQRAITSLSDLLLEPVSDLLEGQQLLVVADGALQYIPFAVLEDPHQPGPPLIARHEILHLPSASALYRVRERQSLRRRQVGSPKKMMAILAAPALGSQAETPPDGTLAGAARALGLEDLTPLPGAEKELAGILQVAPEAFVARGTEATRELVLGGKLADYRILHFATHGLIHPQRAELSGLVLALVDGEGRPRNGFLRLHELYDLDLPADLAVLSSCQTGLGQDFAGEGLVGLARGFMYAGVSRVLVSLWQVRDQSTAELMTRFYHHLLQQNETPASALRLAQLSMLEQEEWRAPAHWAGFVLQGDWRWPRGEGPLEIEDTGGGAPDRTNDDLPGRGASSEAEQQRQTRQFNGLHGNTGRYLFPSLTDRDLADRLLGNEGPDLGDPPPPLDPETLRRLPLLELRDPNRLSETGWGIIFPQGMGGRHPIRRALGPLCEFRRDQVGARKTRYKELIYRPEDSLSSFLSRAGAPRGCADPDRLPYYLLLVGGPDQIPYAFQEALDQGYAVGRICFEKRAKDPLLESLYSGYARNVVDCERSRCWRNREIAFFSPRHPGDSATARTATDLVQPLMEDLAKSRESWSQLERLGPQATKAQLRRLLEEQRQALLFTASHGVGFDSSDERQRHRQGALVCADWPGPQGMQSVFSDQYFTAEDVPVKADLRGLLAFLFSCYSCGTPQRNSFAAPSPESAEAAVLAPRPFVAALPERLLRQGALAVIGHVDRTWTNSFRWQDRREPQTFRSVLRNLLSGWRVGAAMETFGQVDGDLASRLLELRDRQASLSGHEQERYARYWRARKDARNFTILGDPAARVAVPGAALLSRKDHRSNGGSSECPQNT